MAAHAVRPQLQGYLESGMSPNLKGAHFGASYEPDMTALMLAVKGAHVQAVQVRVGAALAVNAPTYTWIR